MNKNLFFAAFVLLAASCSHDESQDSSVNPSGGQNALAPVTVSVSGFAMEQSEFPDAAGAAARGATTRAAAVADYANVKFLTLAFYKSDGTEQYKVTHQKENMGEGETFGVFSTTLPMGSYTMVVVGYGGSSAITLTSATSATFGENRVRETFATTQTVNVTNSSPLQLTATLSRIVSAVAVHSTDNRPAGVTHMRFTFSKGGKGFNPTTGLATSNTGFVNTMDFTGASGATTSTISYLFLATDEQTMDVTIETLDAADGNVLFSKTITDVPLKRNRRTKLTGAIYDANAAAGSFQVNSDWLDDHNMDL